MKVSKHGRYANAMIKGGENNGLRKLERSVLQ